MPIVNIDLTQKIPTPLKKIAFFITQNLKENGYDSYLVGGSVRDMLLGKKCYDLDFTTNAPPQKSMEIFPHHVPVGVEFGTILVLHNKAKIELTTYRIDFDYQDGRRPTQVMFGETLEEDVVRRDFTVNGLAYDIEKKLLFDHVGGLRDIKKKYIRTIGAPLDRFREDGLRPIRACRFAASLSFELDSMTFLAISKSKDVIREVARERFYDEWRKTLPIKGKETFWRLLYETEIHLIFLHPFAFLENQEKRQHFFNFLKIAKPCDMGMYIAYLLYFEFYFKCVEAANSIKFINRQIGEIKKEIRCSVSDIRLAFEYLNSPLFNIIQESGINILKKYPLAYFLVDVPTERIDEHVHFFSEIYCCENNVTISKTKKSIRKKIFEIQKEGLPTKMNQLALNGNDLKALGYKNNEIGHQLRRLHKVVIRYPRFNNMKRLLQLSQQK